MATLGSILSRPCASLEETQTYTEKGGNKGGDAFQKPGEKNWIPVGSHNAHLAPPEHVEARIVIGYTNIVVQRRRPVMRDWKIAHLQIALPRQW